jgi:hypothetical protein
MAIRKKAKQQDQGDTKNGGGETKVVYLNLPFDLALKLAQEAKTEMRPMSNLAARIIKEYYETKR